MNKETAQEINLHCKEGNRFFRPYPGCHKPISPWPGIIKLFPARKSLVSDIPAWEGKIGSLFLQCKLTHIGSRSLLVPDTPTANW
jgi:hypothetical protein